MQEFYRAQIEREWILKERLQNAGVDVNLGGLTGDCRAPQDSTLMLGAEAEMAKQNFASALGQGMKSSIGFDTTDPHQHTQMQQTPMTFGLSGLDTQHKAASTVFTQSESVGDFRQEIPMKVPRQDTTHAPLYQPTARPVASELDSSLCPATPGPSSGFFPTHTAGAGVGAIGGVSQSSLTAAGMQRFDERGQTSFQPTPTAQQFGQQGISEERLHQTAQDILCDIDVQPTNLGTSMNISTSSVWQYGEDVQKPAG